MVRLAYSEQRRCLALSHWYVMRRAHHLSSGYSFLGQHYSPAGPAGLPPTSPGAFANGNGGHAAIGLRLGAPWRC